MTEADSRTLEALSWATRIHDAEFEDWEGHAAWLEADPRNAPAYEQAVLLIEARIVDVSMLPAPPTAYVASNDNPHDEAVARRWWRSTYAWGGALAASLVAISVVPMAMRQSSYLIQTKPGQTRTLTLSEGTSIALNGDSAVRMAANDSRHLTLERGEAYLRVTHDPAHPFELRAGDSVFRDVGTSFDVTNDLGVVNLAVREGAVAFDPDGSNVVLTTGRAILIADGQQQIHSVAASSIGTWRSGRLVYSDTPLAQVAIDLSRTIGEPITLSPGLAHKRFSGILQINRDGEAMLRQLAGILDIDISHTKRGWVFRRHAIDR